MPSFSLIRPSLSASFWSAFTDAAVYSPLAIFTSLESAAFAALAFELEVEPVELDELAVAELALDEADETCDADESEDADEVESTIERRFSR